MRKLATLASAWAVVCLAGSSLALAQESRAALGGRVMDAQGAVVPDVDVAVISDDTRVKQQTRTNAMGNWIVQFLVPGPYSISISATGFRPVERHGITLQTGDNKTVDIQLELGSTSTEVTVTAEAPLIDTTAAVSGTVIAQAQIAEMPSLSRITTVLATLSPGVFQQDQNQNVAHLWSHDAASQIGIDGGNTSANGSTVYRSNDYQIDGMPNLKTGGQAAFIPAPEAVQEFRVVMNAYDAGIGRQTGGTIQMSTKSGTARLHGTLYEYNQNNVLNANLFQTNLAGGEKPAVHYNEYGGTIGGPVWIPKVYNGKEKTFFFFNYNGIRNSDPRFNIMSLPIEAERRGDFSQSYTTNVVGGQRTKYNYQVFDPLTVDAKGARTLFPGMVVPANRLSKVAQGILKYIPMPNTAGDGTSTDANNFVPHSSRQNKMAVVMVRGDHIWNNSHKSFATVRWYHEDELSNDYFGNAFTGAYQHRMTRGAGLDHVWTLSANKVLDLKANITRYEEPNNDHGVGFNSSTLGFPASFTSALFVPAAPRLTGVFGDIGTNQAGSVTDTSNYTWSAVVTHVKGNMTFKYGAEYWVLQQANKNIGNQGRFDFGSEWTRQQNNVSGGTGVGYTLASFMLGLPHNSNSSFPWNADAFWSQRFTALYFQDDWRVNSRLTVNLGLRWDMEAPLTERYNRATANYDPTAISPVNAAAQAAYANVLAKNASNAAVQTLAQLLPAGSFQVRGVQRFNGVDGIARGTSNALYRQFQPRLGFAYRLGANTVVRGGFGRFVQATYVTAGQNGFSRSTPLTTTMDNYMTYYDTLDNPYRNGILVPTGSALGPLTNLGQGPNWTNTGYGRPYSWTYSLHLQHQLKSWLFEVGYSHNRSHGIALDQNMNRPDANLWKQLRAPQFDASGRPVDQLMWDQQVPNPFRGLENLAGTVSTSQTLALNQLLNPIPMLGGITRNNNPLGHNQYDAMLAKIERRFSRGFSVINSFTWSKTMEDVSWLGPDISGRAIEHRLGGEDRPLRLSVAPIWQVPVGRRQHFGSTMPRVLDFVVGGWQLSGQFTIQSGKPITFDDSDSFFFSGKDFKLSGDKQTLAQWFDTSQFYKFPDKGMSPATLATYPDWTGVKGLPGYNYQPASGDTIKNGVYQSFGTYIRTIPSRWSDIRSSRVNNVDAIISKTFSIREAVKFQYRFEAYNLFNHVRFGEPASLDPSSSSFGKVNPTQQNNARTIQMALKMIF